MMKAGTIFRKYENWILPLLCLLVLFAALGLRFDYYYDLNDDVLIKDILSGVYTGEPELWSVQLLWPLGALLGGLYRLFPGTCVFGFFLWLCQAGSLYLILCCSLSYVKTTAGKALLCAAETLAMGVLLLYHLVFVQYTVTAALLMAAAVSLFVTRARALRGRRASAFLIGNLPSVLLAVLAWLLRSEMMLLLLPLAGLAGLWVWSEERPVLTKRNGIAYLGLFGLILAGMLAGGAVDRLACGSAEWEQFGRIFDARTQIYDFKSADLRSYASNQAFYDALGLSEAQCALLENYNFGADDAIDADVLESVAEYGLQTEGYFAHSLSEGLWLYRERLMNNAALGFQEMPYLFLEAAFVVFLLLLSVLKRGSGLIWKLASLAAVRSILWMYLILRERVPDRISHPLYFLEILLLFGLLLNALETSGQETAAKEPAWKETSGQAARQKASGLAGGGWMLRRRGQLSAVCLSFFFIVCLCLLPQAWTKTVQEYDRRESVNQVDRKARAYYGEHPQNLYLADVQSTVEYSQKLFEPARGLGNYDLLGGWACKSPLMEKKLAAFGYTSMGQAVAEGENVRFVGEAEASWEWLIQLLEEEGIQAELVKEEEIFAEGRSLYIWKLERTDA